MCGISGVVGIDDERHELAVHRMMRAMPHRGPDDEGCETVALGQGGSAILGFRRLSILDLTLAGHQPMIDPITGNCLVFNGEIYNYAELRNRLRVEGFRFRSSGDTEVLLAALTAWGDSALDMVDGMFAIAFVDARSRRVLLARDHLGIKPLYISWQTDCLVFASEVRALLASGVVSRDLDPAGVASYFAFGAPQDPLTVHREVRSFPAGACQWIQVDESGRPKAQGSPRRYWRVARTWEKRGSQESDENPAEIRSLFLRTVEQQCQSDVPLGVLLSAGLDSTLIASAVKASGFDLKTFSVGVDDERVDTEVSVARRTAARLGSEHHEFILNDHNIQGLWDGWLRVADRPGVDGFNTYLACSSIHGSCVKVALSGVGADELFGGYGSFIRARRLGGAVRLWQWMPLGARKFLARSVVELAGERFRKHQWRIDLMSSLRSSRPTDLAIALKRLLGNLEIQGLGFDASELGLMDDYLSSEASAALWFDEADSFRAVSCVETCLYMQNTLLRDSDINSMAHSLELRVPFVGRRFVEQALRLPSSVHINAQRVGKQVLRRALSDLVPDEVLNRPKTGFALPFERWMFTKLLDSCEAAIEGLREIPFLNYGQARAMWERFKKNPHSSHWLRPMLLVAMGSYADSNARTFIDAAGAIKIRARE